MNCYFLDISGFVGQLKVQAKKNPHFFFSFPFFFFPIFLDTLLQHQRTPELCQQHGKDKLPEFLTQSCSRVAPGAISREVVSSGSSAASAAGHAHPGWAQPWKPPQAQQQVWGHLRAYGHLQFCGCHFISYATVCYL